MEDYSEFSCDGCFKENVEMDKRNVWSLYGQLVLCKKCYRLVRRSEIVDVAKRKCTFNRW